MKSEHSARSIKQARVLRLQKKAHEAMLQCRRLHALHVVPEQAFSALLAEAQRVGADLWMTDAPPDAASRSDPAAMDSGGDPSEQALDLPPRRPGTPLLAVIGPEGGLSEAEKRALQQAGARSVCLGKGVLRVETAALALVARLAL